MVSERPGVKWHVLHLNAYRRGVGVVWRQTGASEDGEVRQESEQDTLRNSAQREASSKSLFILFISMVEDLVPLTTMAVEFLADGWGIEEMKLQRRKEVTD